MVQITQIKLLIADNKIDKAAEQLMELAASENDLLNQIILLKNQFADYTRNVTLNLSDRNEERARVVNGMLYVTDEIAKTLKEIEKTIEKPEKTAKKPSDTEGGVWLKGQQDVIAMIWTTLLSFMNNDPDLYIATWHEELPELKKMKKDAPKTVGSGIIYEVQSMEVLRYETMESLTRVVVKYRVPHDPTDGTLETYSVYMQRNESGIWKNWAWVLEEER